MRVSLAVTGLTVLLAGCAQAPEDQSHTDNSAAATRDSAPAVNAERSADEAATSVVAAPDPLAPRRIGEPGNVPSPPEISPDSAPDVAFGYRYSFGLAADRVAPVQQRHARLCEELGAERCRVTGMTYRRGQDDHARAELRLALEPGLAHRFGERALDGVREAEGSLVDSQITGTDVGTGIRASTRTIAQLEEQLAELEAGIARGGRVGTLRDLRAEAEALREQIRALRTDRGERREQLATTPMTLTYTSDFAAISPALRQFRSVANGLLPWLLAAAMFWLAIQALRRRRGADAAEPAPVA